MFKSILYFALLSSSVFSSPITGTPPPKSDGVQLPELTLEHLTKCLGYQTQTISPFGNEGFASVCLDLFEKDVPSLRAKVFNNKQFIGCMNGNKKTCEAWKKTLDPTETAVFEKGMEMLKSLDEPAHIIKERIKKSLDESPYTKGQSVGRLIEKNVNGVRDLFYAVSEIMKL